MRFAAFPESYINCLILKLKLKATIFMPGLDAPSLLAIQQRTIQTAARVFIYAMGLETCYEEAPHNKPIVHAQKRL